MIKAIWNDKVIAQTDHVEVVEGNDYFPLDTLDMQYFRSSATQSTCSWKGVASYYDIVVDGKTNGNGAWIYRTPKSAAAEIAGHVAFWHGVQIVRDDD